MLAHQVTLVPELIPTIIAVELKQLLSLVWLLMLLDHVLTTLVIPTTFVTPLKTFAVQILTPPVLSVLALAEPAQQVCFSSRFSVLHEIYRIFVFELRSTMLRSCYGDMCSS